jgi:hypothetical protein
VIGPDLGLVETAQIDLSYPELDLAFGPPMLPLVILGHPCGIHMVSRGRAAPGWLVRSWED